MLREGVIHISGIANPHIQSQRIANPLGREKQNASLIMIKRAYYRIYYCLFFGLQKSIGGPFDFWLALIAATMYAILLFLNLIAITCIWTIITRYYIFQMFPWEWSMLLFVGLNFILFLPKKKYFKVITMFESEEKTVQKKRRTWCVIYIVISWISVPSLFYILEKLGMWYYNPT